MDELTKDQIQIKYNETVAKIGDRLYKFALPFVEIGELMYGCLNLSRAHEKLILKEYEEKRKKDEPVAEAQNG